MEETPECPSVPRTRATATRTPTSRPPLASIQIAALLDSSRRPGRHPQVGDVTVRDILHEWVHHDREHLAQLTALTQRLVWPGMGNARRLSEPDA